MALVRAIGLCILIGTIPAAAESVGIELTPQGSLLLELTAANQPSAVSLGAALARSLGCTLSGVSDQPSGAGWKYRANCLGVFHRNGQVVDGQLKLAAFRQTLIKANVDQVRMDIGIPDTPYWRAGLPKSWEQTCKNGVIHRTSDLEPKELPARAIRVSVGYRIPELALIAAPIPLSILLAFALVVWLNRSAAKATQMDPRALWFSYVRALAWGVMAVYLVWAALWAAIAGGFAGETDVWALFSVWNGRSIIAGKLVATSLFLLLPVIVALLCAVWRPHPLAALTSGGGLRAFLLPSLALVVPAFWTLAAFSALGGGGLVHVVTRMCVAATVGMMLRFVARSGRGGSVVTSGPVLDRLSALAAKHSIGLGQVVVVPAGDPHLIEAIEVSGGNIAISEYAWSVMDPAEIEAEAARRWSLPLQWVPDLARVLVWFASLGVALVASLIVFAFLAIPLGALQLLLRVHGPTLSARLALGTAIPLAALLARMFHRWFARRADRKAAALIGDADALRRAHEKMGATRLAPGAWGKAEPIAATPEAQPTLPVAAPAPAPVFSPGWRKTVVYLKVEGTILALSIPPVATAIAVRSRVIPAAARWPAYLAAMALALLLRVTVAKAVEHWSYRRMRGKLAARLQVAEAENTIFVGLSPEPRPLVYDGFWDWDLGFLTVSPDRLEYRGERARFTLRREQVAGIQIGKGSDWEDPFWIYVSWRDAESGREGKFPLIVPRVHSPWRLAKHVAGLCEKLTEWRNRMEPRTMPADAERAALPVFVAAGTSRPNQIPQMLLMIVLGGFLTSVLAKFPLLSQATFYFAAVWSANALIDQVGHRLAQTLARVEAR
jgi:hypothetical protein